MTLIFNLVTLTLIYDLSFNVCEQCSRITLTLTLSCDLELKRQGTQGGLAAADRGKTVDDGQRKLSMVLMNTRAQQSAEIGDRGEAVNLVTFTFIYDLVLHTVTLTFNYDLDLEL